MGVSGHLHALTSLAQGKSPLNSMNQRLDETQS